MNEDHNINDIQVENVNAHLHTPYSFSAFRDIPEALDMALMQDVMVVGINDFNTMEGYREWDTECRKRGLYPMFNIEMISLRAEEKKNGIRVNDPNNPGRTYLSGKGLAYPVMLREPYLSQLADVVRESDRQTEAMCVKLNNLLEASGEAIRLDINKIRTELTKGHIRERHLAKALRLEIYAYFKNDPEKISAFIRILFGGKPLVSGIDDYSGVENEIRSSLLKSGGPAFIPEDPKAFLTLENVNDIIMSAGGIPTYPFLADDAKGFFTDFEEDLKKAAGALREKGIYSAEFIPTRNSAEVLERYAAYLWDNGFIVTFGSEHNTPAMEPIELFTRERTPLSGKLKKINYLSACVIAAHQDMVGKGGAGYPGKDHTPDMVNREKYIAYGDRIIKQAIGKI